MARTYTEEQIEKQYENLPDVLKDAMESAEISSKMLGIGKKFGLTVEQIGFMSEETGFVALGFTRPEEFAGFLGEKLKIAKDKAEEIAKEINRGVFFPMREALKKTHNIEIGGETETGSERAGIPVYAKPKSVSEEIKTFAEKIGTQTKTAEPVLPKAAKPETPATPPKLPQARPEIMRTGIFAAPPAAAARPPAPAAPKIPSAPAVPPAPAVTQAPAETPTQKPPAETVKIPQPAEKPAEHPFSAKAAPQESLKKELKKEDYPVPKQNGPKSDPYREAV